MTQNFMLNLYFILHINTTNIRSYSSWYRGAGGGWVTPCDAYSERLCPKGQLFSSFGFIKWYRIS